jgi:hypothetical protein
VKTVTKNTARNDEVSLTTAGGLLVFVIYWMTISLEKRLFMSGYYRAKILSRASIPYYGAAGAYPSTLGTG